MAPRVIKDAEVRSARDDFKIGDYFKKKVGTERREIWFRALDYAWASYSLLVEGDPAPELLVEPLERGLKNDLALGAWMQDRTNAAWRAVQSNWRLVERALAGVIVQAYLDACEDGSWKRTC